MSRDDDYGEDADVRLQRLYDEAAPGETHTLDRIATAMGVTRERVRQIEAKALRTFRSRLWRLLKADGITEEEMKR
tara:strand:- start:14453 stop:14680 length:228 start_codon:yes stop_codon:yes gene_type:complete